MARRRVCFPRAARLKRRRLIRPLFERQRPGVGRVGAGSVTLVYRVVPRALTGQDVPVQIGFAPGRTATKVLRNRLRRQLRETYRVHQHILVDLFSHRPDATLTVMVLLRGPSDAERRRRDFVAALHRLAARLASPP